MFQSLTSADLAQFTGSSVWHRHSMVCSVFFTEGVHYVASSAMAYWLIDEIAFAQLHPKLGREKFQRWTLAVSDHRGLLSCDDSNGRKLFKKRLSFTDFPREEFTLYCCDNVILLPGEY